MRVSALVVNWNTREDLARCLASLPGDVEAIVVDNASTDGSARMVAERFPCARLIANEVNRGYAEGNNQAAEAAGGDFLFFLNPDTIVPPGAVEALTDFLTERPAAGLVAPRLILPDGSTQASVRGMPAPVALAGAVTGLDRLFPPGAEWASYMMPWFDYDREQQAPQPMASAWMVRRAAWDDVGPFDPAFPLFFNDVDWCLRAQRKGWEVWYSPRTSVTHVGGASTRQIKPRAIRESHRALGAFYRKHYAETLGPVRTSLYTTLIHAAGALRASRVKGMMIDG